MTEPTNPISAQPEILIVEDSAVEAEMLRRILVRAGYRVTAAKNGKEGLQALREHPCALVMSDINMPLMNGYELCRAIKLDENLWGTPVMLVTSLAEPKDIISALDVGADGYITKPYVEDVLLGRIRSLLANPANRELAEERRKIQVEYDGKNYIVAVGGQQMANLLLSVYGNSLILNHELMRIQNQLNVLNESLEEQVRERTIAFTESEEKFRKISESAQDAIMLMGVDQCISFWNPAAERIFGYTAAEAMGQKLHALIVTPPDHARFSQAFPHFQKTGEGPIIGKVRELTALRKGGVEFPVELSVSAAQFGGQWHAIGIVRDITERKRAENTLKESERNYRDIVNNAVVGVYKTNLKGDLLFVNQAMAKIYEFESPEEMMSGSVIARYKNIEDRKKLIDGLLKTGFVDNFEVGVTTKGGRTKNILLSASLYGDVISGIITDITDRKRAETLLRESEEKLRTIFNGALDGICLADVETTQFADVNPEFCRMLGYSHEELTRLGVADIHPPQDWPHVSALFERMARGEIQLATDIPVKHKDGSVFYADIKGSFVSYAGKNYLMGIFRDTTERRMAESRLNDQLDELRRWQEATMGREMRSLELKREVNELLKQAGQPPRYLSAE